MADGLIEAASGNGDDPHESVTIAPPAPHSDDLPQPEPQGRSLSAQSDAHFEAVLEAGSRAGSSLNALARMVSELSRGLTGARDANERLVQELTTLRAMLGAANEQRLSLGHRLALVEQELRDARLAHEHDIRFLSEQHDEFVAGLVEEHEEALASSRQELEGATLRMPDVAVLNRQLVQAETARLEAEAEVTRARDTLARVQAQRDEAQARVSQRELERDELRAEASQLRARLEAHRPTSTLPPPAVVTSRPPSFRGAMPLDLDAGELDTNLHARSSTPRLPAVRPRATPLPPDATPSAHPFPRETTRPGVGRPPATAPRTFPGSPARGAGWTPIPPAPEPSAALTRLGADPSPTRHLAAQSAATLPPGLPSPLPQLRNKPDPATRPLTEYSLGDGIAAETLEGARLSSKPPRK
jgi:predicted  nucleic acid-binding Zn-ribbon protein